MASLLTSTSQEGCQEGCQVPFYSQERWGEIRSWVECGEWMWREGKVVSYHAKGYLTPFSPPWKFRYTN